jgi:prepilin-type N-terminal cleavage/methylation domain-containing protein
MKMKLQVAGCRLQVPQANLSARLFSTFNFQLSTFNPRQAFTIVELLTVLGIMALLAALAVPALKNFGHADAMTAASAQIMGDAGRARQLAISQRTTVYMVFLPANFWNNPFYNTAATYTTWWNNLPAAQRTAVTNLCDKQLTGYALLAYGAVGDQPGNHQWHYLTPWQALPEGTFIVTNKFDAPFQFSAIATPKQPVSSVSLPLFGLWNQGYPHLDRNSIYAFTNVAVPFPVEGAPSLSLPYIAFNYLGQLTLQSLTPQPLQQDEYIPLARGSVNAAVDADTKEFQLNPPQVIESPPGNGTNAYNIVHIDWLTGRALPEQPRIQ